MATDDQDYDFVIVGGGSAGAIVATRLAEDSNNRVLVLEAGPENTSYWSRVPLGFAKILFNPRFMWLDWKTQPDESLGGTVFALPHGKLLGGSSAINGLVAQEFRRLVVRHLAVISNQAGLELYTGLHRIHLR